MPRDVQEIAFAKGVSLHPGGSTDHGAGKRARTASIVVSYPQGLSSQNPARRAYLGSFPSGLFKAPSSPFLAPSPPFLAPTVNTVGVRGDKMEYAKLPDWRLVLGCLAAVAYFVPIARLVDALVE